MTMLATASKPRGESSSEREMKLPAALDHLVASHRVIDVELVDQFGPADGVEEGAPVGGGIGQHGHPAVFCSRGFAFGHAFIARRADGRFETEATHHVDGVERRQRFEHRHFDQLADAAAFALIEGGTNRRDDGHAGDFIGYQTGDELCRRALR